MLRGSEGEKHPAVGEGIRARLLKAASIATTIPFRGVQLKNGEKPLQNKCFANVQKWIKENPSDHAIRGWLVSGFILDKHVIVQSKLCNRKMESGLTSRLWNMPFHSASTQEATKNSRFWLLKFISFYQLYSP